MGVTGYKPQDLQPHYQDKGKAVRVTELKVLKVVHMQKQKMYKNVPGGKIFLFGVDGNGVDGVDG